MNNRFLIACLLLLGITWSSCSDSEPSSDPIQEELKSLIQPPIPELVKDFERFEVQIAQGGAFKLPSGSSITVPAQAFVDEDGKAVTGKAELRFREYQDAVDVFLSGIPMRYQNGRFETAGMFEVRAAQGERVLEVAPGKSLDVRLASMKAEEDYDFFSLNEYEGWTMVDSSVKPEINTEKVVLKKKIKKMNPGLKFPLNSRYFVGNYQAILDIEFNDNWKKIKENKDNPAVSKKAESYGLSWYDFQMYGDVTFKGNKYASAMMVWKKISGKPFPKWMRNPKDYKTNIVVKPLSGSTYIIEAKENYQTSKEPDYTCKIRAIMPLKRLYAFSPDYWKSNYEEAMAKIEQEEERMLKMAEVYRSFDVQGMGIYNYDRLMKPEEAFAINADFFSSVSGSEAFELDRVYALATKEEAVIDLPKSDWENLYISKNYPLRFIAVLPNQKMGVYTVEQYMELDFEGLRAESGTPSLRFELKPQGTASSEEELRTLVHAK